MSGVRIRGPGPWCDLHTFAQATTVYDWLVYETESLATAILRQRDSASRSRPAAAEAPECPFCMEPYAEAGLHVPRILPCGHTGCQDCFARLLRPIVAEANNVKRLTCPNCREVADVSWGRAENLPQVFALLR